VIEGNLSWYWAAQGILAAVLLLHPATRELFKRTGTPAPGLTRASSRLTLPVPAPPLSDGISADTLAGPYDDCGRQWMRLKVLVSAVAATALLAVGSANVADAVGGLPFQVLLNSDGSGQIFMNDGSSPDWKACRPDLTECVPFAKGNFDTGAAPPETVFWAGGNVLTPLWKGNVHSTVSPSVSGEVRANQVVTPVAGQWAGGWKDDYDELTLAICEKATGEDCLTVNHEGSEFECGGRGATLIDPAFAGWYLRITDHRYGSGTLFAGVGHPFYYREREPAPGPTVSVAVVGKIAPATGAPSVKCGPRPLISGSISRTGSASIECRVVGCHVKLIARRGRRAAKLVRRVPPSPGFTESPTEPLRFTPSALRRLGNGPVRLRLEIDSETVARRTVGGRIAEEPVAAGAAFTGLRQGELLALRWMHVDFIGGLPHVRRNFTDGREKVPKGKRVRSVPMMSEVVDTLATLIEIQGWPARQPAVDVSSGNQPLALATPHSVARRVAKCGCSGGTEQT
jgi:hypothetical protein